MTPTAVIQEARVFWSHQEPTDHHWLPKKRNSPAMYCRNLENWEFPKVVQVCYIVQVKTEALIPTERSVIIMVL